MTPQRWFDRTFALGLQPRVAPELLVRLESLPDRLASVVRGLPREALIARHGDKWSIQENVGHLLDLEPLWEQRLDDFDEGAEVLHAADLENRKTHEANHNQQSLDELLEELRTVRHRIVARLRQMTPLELSRTALHPRLRQPMSVVDLCFFVAEHDDHHLRTIEELKTRSTAS